MVTPKNPVNWQIDHLRESQNDIMLRPMEKHNTGPPNRICLRCCKAPATVTIATSMPFAVCRPCEEQTRVDLFGESRNGFDSFLAVDSEDDEAPRRRVSYGRIAASAS
jgi:hypothetical protein